MADVTPVAKLTSAVDAVTPSASKLATPGVEYNADVLCLLKRWWGV